MIKNALSVDVEEIFQGEYIKRYNSSKIVYRTPENLSPILELFKEYDVSATFFIVGEIAEKYPDLIELIRKEGHEIAFHGWSHIPLWRLDSDSFKKEVSEFRNMCPECVGFRAPSFSLNNNTKWALRILKDQGFEYDSSVFPTWTPLYGSYLAPSQPYKPSFENILKIDNDNHFFEFPLLVYSLLGLRIPAAGGFWLRLFNTGFIVNAIKRANIRGIPAVLFFHNWEVDRGVQRVNLPRINKFVTYHNQEIAINKLIRILNIYKFTSIKECLYDLS